MQPADRSRQHSHIALVLSSRYHEACGTPLWKEGERERVMYVCLFIPDPVGPMIQHHVH